MESFCVFSCALRLRPGVVVKRHTCILSQAPYERENVIRSTFINLTRSMLRSAHYSTFGENSIQVEWSILRLVFLFNLNAKESLFIEKMFNDRSKRKSQIIASGRKFFCSTIKFTIHQNDIWFEMIICTVQMNNNERLNGTFTTHESCKIESLVHKRCENMSI